MDFRLNDDQEALQQTLRSFCTGRLPLDRLASLESADARGAGLWQELADMGVFGLRLPEERGGVGLGAAEAVLVFAELGRVLAPGPLLWTHLSAELVDGAATGETVVGGLDRRTVGQEPILIEHLEQLDVLLVLDGGGVIGIDPRAIDAEPIAMPLDPLTPVHHAPELPAGERIAGSDVAARLARDGAAFAAAQQLGIAEATTELAVAYAGQREQFGRAIGSFQAVKHILADMFVHQEVARAAVYAAGATIDQPEVGDVDRAVSAAAVTASDAARRNARACIQVHGGMGYTWEMPAHYFLKRTWVLESSFGSCDFHAARVAEQLS